MNASEYIKGRGLPNLKYVADAASIDRQKLNRWYTSNFALFEIIVAGCVSKGEKMGDVIDFPGMVKCLPDTTTTEIMGDGFGFLDRVTGLDPEEKGKLEMDIILYGSCMIKCGKRVDPFDVYIEEKEE